MVKRALVVGLGYRTGLSAANFLAARGVHTVVSDLKSREELSGIIEKLDPEVGVITGRQEPSILDEGFDLVVLSPGVPVTIPLIREARKQGIPVVSEIELSYLFMKGKIIAITGTDGKSTTTAMTGSVLGDLGFRTFVGGNIGIPMITLAEQTTDDSVSVIELSSFQLETVDTFHPDVSAVLNIGFDHMDRYRDVEDYLGAKMRIVSNQTGEDFFIYNIDDSRLKAAAGGVPANARSFSIEDLQAHAFYNGKGIVIRADGTETEVLRAEDMKIMGVHNIQNAMACLLMVTSLLEKKGIEPDYELIARSICAFPGLEHRMERVGEFMGRVFVNDSKATTVTAVEMAVKSITGGGVIILGGRTKGDDYARLSESIDPARWVPVLIGESREMFAEIFEGFRYHTADSLDDAVAKAMSESAQGQAILLSPACASFDMFSSFEHRGDAFKRAFEKLVQGELAWT